LEKKDNIIDDDLKSIITSNYDNMINNSIIEIIKNILKDYSHQENNQIIIDLNKILLRFNLNFLIVNDIYIDSNFIERNENILLTNEDKKICFIFNILSIFMNIIDINKEIDNLNRTYEYLNSLDKIYIDNEYKFYYLRDDALKVDDLKVDDLKVDDKIDDDLNTNFTKKYVEIKEETDNINKLININTIMNIINTYYELLYNDNNRIKQKIDYILNQGISIFSMAPEENKYIINTINRINNKYNEDKGAKLPLIITHDSNIVKEFLRTNFIKPKGNFISRLSSSIFGKK